MAYESWPWSAQAYLSIYVNTDLAQRNVDLELIS